MKRIDKNKLLAIATFLVDSLSSEEVMLFAQKLQDDMQDLVNTMSYEELRKLRSDLEQQDFEAVEKLDAQIANRFEV